MEIKYGLNCCDSHGQLGKEAFTSRMSKAKWGNQIPHIIETRDKAFDYPVERWVINGKVQGDTSIVSHTTGHRQDMSSEQMIEMTLEVSTQKSKLPLKGRTSWFRSTLS